MSIKRIFIAISAIFAASAVFADNSSVTSKKYVDDLMSGYQGKLPGSGANTLMIYDDETGIGEKSIEATLVSNATGVPTVSAVKTGLDGVQDTITGTAGYVMTGTGTPGEVGERAIYNANTNYTDSLVTAETVNTAVINAVNNSLIRVNENGNSDANGTLWQIVDYLPEIYVHPHLPDGYTDLQYIETDGTQYINTRKYCTSNNITIETKVFTQNTPSAEQDIIGNLESKTIAPRFVLGLSLERIFVYDRDASGAEPSGNLYSPVLSGAQTLNIRATYDYTIGKRILNVNGATYNQDFTKTISNNNQPIILLAYPNGNNAFVGKVYYLKYMEDGVLKMNLIPARHDNNGTVQVGFYDTVNNEFLTSSTSSAFTEGPPVGN